MEREKILEKSRNSHSEFDEYTSSVYKNSLQIGLLVGCILSFIFEVVSIFQGANYWGYHAIIFAVAGVSSLLYYKKIKKKQYLVQGIIAALIAVGSVFGFFMFG